MAAAEASMNIRDHGVVVENEKNRVRCNYCNKEVGGFYRLKCHLGGIRGDVKPCESVPVEVKETMRKLVVEKQTGKTNNKRGKPSPPVNLENEKMTPSPNLSNHPETKKIKSIENVRSDDLKMVLATDIDGEVEMNAPSLEAKRCIGRFFYEMGIDINAARSTSFERLINSVVAHPQIVRDLPSCEELRGRIFQKELEDMNNYVREIQESWPHTGCSILLDGWVDAGGRSLMNVLVDCPKGTIYLRSYNISAYAGDAFAMQLLINEVVEEVGQSNVVQIIRDSMEPSCMLDVERLSVSMHKTFFWNLSASYCLELILKEMAEMDHVQDTLTQAKIITRFFHRDADSFCLMKDHIHGCPDLVSTPSFKFAKPFLTLENILSEKKNLERIIESSKWVSITTKGKEDVAYLVRDGPFWYGIEMVLKAATPIVNVLNFINSAAKPQIGYIYEIMDQAKEKIQDAYEYEDEYGQYWDLIDKVWDNCLHSPLHAAAYHLNPSLFFSSDTSQIDNEVESGFQQTVARLVQDEHIQNQIYHQVDLHYRTSSGAFRHGSVIARTTNVSPAEWWSCLGEQCPQLQRFATRILSQTCDGAYRYGLKRSLAEKLLTTGIKNLIEQQRLSDLTFLHYNLQLQNFNADGDGRVTETEEINPMDDWIVENHFPY